MISKFLHYCIYTVKSPITAQYSTAVFIMAENEEHATICLQDYFFRHSMTADIISVQMLSNFLIASEDQYPKSKLLKNLYGTFDEIGDLP